MNKETSDIVDRIIYHAHNRPDKIAFGNFSYRQVAKKMCSLSLAINGMRVLVACENREESYIGMLASLHAGATYAPVDVSAPEARLNRILDKFRPTDIIVGLKDQDRFETVHRVGSECRISRQVVSDLPAYVIFTSGSTGEPKGVVISRKALNHFLKWSASDLGISHNSRISQHPNVAFDLSVLDIYTGLYNGAQIFPIQSSIDKMFPGRCIQRNKLTHWISVPSVVDLIAKDVSIKHNDFATLEKMIFCGEPLLPRHLEYIYNLNEKLIVFNTYGPTEATVCMTKLELTSKDWRSKINGSVALGDAIPGMEIELKDGRDNSEGEIIISGGQIAEGYWLQPELTNKVFVDNKYHTGDWAEIIDGEIYFKSRIDRQVKVHGNRVELGDIEQCIYDLTKKATACIKHQDRIIAYIEGSEINQTELLNKISENIVEYMRPYKIICLNDLPRNINDKIDYNSLAALAEEEV